MDQFIKKIGCDLLKHHGLICSKPQMAFKDLMLIQLKPKMNILMASLIALSIMYCKRNIKLYFMIGFNST